MPLYEYECQKCGHRFEKLVPRSAARQPQQCPKCGATDTRRLMSTFAARSTGGGGVSCAPSG